MKVHHAALLALLLIVAAGFGFQGASLEPATTGQTITWGSKNATGVTGPLKFGQAVQYDTSRGSVEGWAVTRNSTITDLIATCGNTTGNTPNCTLQVFTAAFGAAPVAVVELQWDTDTTATYGAEGMTASYALDVDVDKGDLLCFYLKANATSSVTPDYPNVQLVMEPR